MSTRPPQASDALTIPKSALRRLGLVLAALIVLVLIVLVILLAARNSGSKDTLASAINSNEYQAVFLSNGQVYFGKMTSPGGDFYYLRHVYYLRSQASRRGAASGQTLIKLTTDINTPEDLMVINIRNILFVENLSPSGKAARLLASSP